MCRKQICGRYQPAGSLTRWRLCACSTCRYLHSTRSKKKKERQARERQITTCASKAYSAVLRIVSPNCHCPGSDDLVARHRTHQYEQRHLAYRSRVASSATQQHVHERHKTGSTHERKVKSHLLEASGDLLLSCLCPQVWCRSVLEQGLEFCDARPPAACRSAGTVRRQTWRVGHANGLILVTRGLESVSVVEAP